MIDTQAMEQLRIGLASMPETLASNVDTEYRFPWIEGFDGAFSAAFHNRRFEYPRQVLDQLGLYNCDDRLRPSGLCRDVEGAIMATQDYERPSDAGKYDQGAKAATLVLFFGERIL